MTPGQGTNSVGVGFVGFVRGEGKGLQWGLWPREPGPPRPEGGPDPTHSSPTIFVGKLMFSPIFLSICWGGGKELKTWLLNSKNISGASHQVLSRGKGVDPLLAHIGGGGSGTVKIDKIRKNKPHKVDFSPQPALSPSWEARQMWTPLGGSRDSPGIANPAGSCPKHLQWPFNTNPRGGAPAKKQSLPPTQPNPFLYP